MLERFILCLVVVALCVTGVVGQSRRKRPISRRQPIVIEVPKELMQQLSRDDKEVRDFMRDTYPTDPKAYKFWANLVDLNGDGKSEFIVEPPIIMMGNSSGPIWVYRRTASSYELLLSTGGMSLIPLKTSTRGYRDLENGGGGISMGYFREIYMFDGRKYVLSSRRNNKSGVF